MELIHVLQSYASPTLDAVMLAVTRLAMEQAYIAFLVVAYLAVDAVVGQRLAIALLASLYLNYHLKGVFDTPRPYVLEPAVARSEEAVLTGPGAGFPSGHAQSSATFWGLAALYARRGWFWALALVLVALIALSRIYLGVHLPVDVLGGLVIGAAVAGAAYAVFAALPHRGALGLPLVLGLGVLVPLALHLVWPVADSAMLLGGLAAFITGPRVLPYGPPRGVGARVLVAALGLVLVFAALLGSSAMLPEALKRDPVLGFVRYLLLGYVGVLLTPWLARRLGLARG